MRLEELIKTLSNPDMLRIIKDEKEVFVGYLAIFITEDEKGENGSLFNRCKDEEVKRFQAVPEIRHKKWKELNLMKPLRPEETPDFRFSDLQMKLYYTIYI